MAESFFERWSQRKRARGVSQAPGVVGADRASEARDAEAGEVIVPKGEAPASLKVAAPPALTLADVQRLSSESDFGPFVAREVTPEVRNAAMKKLFADPHYQVMDRLDTYIDDYSIADPLPEAALRQMVAARFLGLFADEDEGAKKQARPAGANDGAASPAVHSLTQFAPTPPTAPDHDHTDLRLQPNDAAGPAAPGRSAG